MRAADKTTLTRCNVFNGHIPTISSLRQEPTTKCKPLRKTIISKFLICRGKINCQERVKSTKRESKFWIKGHQCFIQRYVRFGTGVIHRPVSNQYYDFKYRGIPTFQTIRSKKRDQKALKCDVNLRLLGPCGSLLNKNTNFWPRKKR